MVIVGGDAFVKGVKGNAVGKGQGRVHIQEGDPLGDRVKSTHRRDMGDIQIPDKTALVKMGNDQTISLGFKLFKP